MKGFNPLLSITEYESIAGVRNLMDAVVLPKVGSMIMLNQIYYSALPSKCYTVLLPFKNNISI